MLTIWLKTKKISACKTDIVKYLIEIGAEVDVSKALYSAAGNNHAECLKFLIVHGANIEEEEPRDGSTEDEEEHYHSHYDYNPSQEECTHSHNLVEQRERASYMEILNDPYAVIDHIPYSHCAGGEGDSFQEATHIPQRSRGSWAETFGSICAELGEASDPRNLAPLNK